MKLKKSLLTANVFILITLLSACGQGVDNNSDFRASSNTENFTAVSEAKIPKKVQKDLGTNLSVDATIEGPTILPLEVEVIPAKIMDLKNQQEVMTLFSPNQILNKIREDNFKYRDGQIGTQEYFKSKNGDFFNWGGKSLNCSKTLIYDIQEAFSPEPTAQKLYPSKDLPFMTQKEAEQKARNFLSLLGVTAGNDVHVFSLDYQAMQNEQTKHQKEVASAGMPTSKQRPVRKWTLADDCYVFQFQIELNGIPVAGQLQFGNPKGQTQTQGTTLLMYYGEQGVVNAQISNVYKASGGATEKAAPLNLDQALIKLNDKFDDVIMNSPIMVTDIKLSYVPKLKAANQEIYFLTPAWIFSLSQYSKDIEGNVKTMVIINALTGEEME